MRRLRLDELEATHVAGVSWKPVRAELGIRAFGVNAYSADAGELVVEPHDETGGGAGGHQEVYLVVSGRATFTVAGEEVDAPAITFVLVEPGEHREAHAAEDGTVVLALGGKPGEPYRVSEWEYRFRAWRAYQQGSREDATALLAEGLAEHPDSPSIRFMQAWYALDEGDEETAVRLLHEALALDEERMRRWVDQEASFDRIRARL